VSQARSFASRILSQWGVISDEVVLVTSELATNAVLHGKATFTVSLHKREDCIRVEVADVGPGEPSMIRGASVMAASGRGLAIVAQVAEKWGVLPSGQGKTVWAELPCRPRQDRRL
jgi:anti-sigma regulatory factor (Ser/Thr protein kinase)